MVTETSIIEGPRFETAPPDHESRLLLLSVVLSLIAVLFLIGGFMLFDAPTKPLEEAENPVTTNDAVYPTTDLQTTADTSTVIEAMENSTELSVTTSSTNLANVDVIIATSSGDTFILEAQAGDGVTHLARRAVGRYLEENGITALFTQEHRIYMEDFVKDKTGNNSLSLGDEIVINKELLQEAAKKAQMLTDKEINNLQQYVALVPSLAL